MKKFNAIIVSLIVVFSSCTQFDSSNNLNCYYLNDTINSTNYNQYIDTLGTHEFHQSLTDEEQLQFLDCLLSFDSVDPKLNLYKAFIIQARNENDTSFFKYYRVCISSNYAKGIAYYNMGAFYINQFSKQELTDTSEFLSESKTDRERQLDLAEKLMWLSYQSGYKEPIFSIGEIHNLRNDFLNIPQPGIKLDQDSMIILTHIKDCGEFGGHFEMISLINNEDHFVAEFHSDSIYCMNEKTKASFNSRYNGIREIVCEDILESFINNAESYKAFGINNAPVEIAFICNSDVIYKRIDNHDWPHYIEFRKMVFNF